MTTSGTVAYSLTASELIEAAFNNLGIAQEGEALTPRMYQDGLRGLNLLIKTWGAHYRLWIMEEGSLTMTADTPSYVITPKPLRIVEARYRQTTSQIDVPMTEFSRQEYFDQPNKTTSPSIPVNFYFDPQTTTGTLYLWPCPSATVAADYSIKYTYVRRMESMVSTNDELDMPQEWQEAVTWNLSKRLAAQYPVNDATLLNLIIGMATETYQALMGWDNEPASLFMQPETRWPNNA